VEVAVQAEDMLHTCSLRWGDTVVLQLSGELDMATAPLVDRAVSASLADHPRQVRLDLTELTFCDRTGLRALTRARNAARAVGAGFRITGVHPRTRRLLALLHATDLLKNPAA
jgi:anti-sigma B factor antagonist